MCFLNNRSYGSLSCPKPSFRTVPHQQKHVLTYNIPFYGQQQLNRALQHCRWGNTQQLQQEALLWIAARVSGKKCHIGKGNSCRKPKPSTRPCVLISECHPLKILSLAKSSLSGHCKKQTKKPTNDQKISFTAQNKAVLATVFCIFWRVATMLGCCDSRVVAITCCYTIARVFRWFLAHLGPDLLTANRFLVLK